MPSKDSFYLILYLLYKYHGRYSQTTTNPNKSPFNIKIDIGNLYFQFLKDERQCLNASQYIKLECVYWYPLRWIPYYPNIPTISCLWIIMTAFVHMRLSIKLRCYCTQFVKRAMKISTYFSQIYIEELIDLTQSTIINIVGTPA